MCAIFHKHVWDIVKNIIESDVLTRSMNSDKFDINNYYNEDCKY